MKISTIIRSLSLATLFVTSSTLSAGTINTFQFVDYGSDWVTYGTNSPSLGTGSGSKIGKSKVFEGSNGLETTVSFFKNVKDDGTGGKKQNGVWGHGLSVKNDFVDNNGEALLFDFEKDVTALSSFFWGWGSKDKSDVAAFYNDNGSWSSINTVAFTGYLSLDMKNIVSDQFLFVNVDARKNNDRWAFKGLAVETIATTVPAPGMLALLGLGLVGFGLRRRKSA